MQYLSDDKQRATPGIPDVLHELATVVADAFDVTGSPELTPDDIQAIRGLLGTLRRMGWTA